MEGKEGGKEGKEKIGRGTGEEFLSCRAQARGDRVVRSREGCRPFMRRYRKHWAPSGGIVCGVGCFDCSRLTGSCLLLTPVFPPRPPSPFSLCRACSFPPWAVLPTSAISIPGSSSATRCTSQVGEEGGGIMRERGREEWRGACGWQGREIPCKEGDDEQRGCRKRWLDMSGGHAFRRRAAVAIKFVHRLAALFLMLGPFGPLLALHRRSGAGLDALSLSPRPARGPARGGDRMRLHQPPAPLG